MNLEEQKILGSVVIGFEWEFYSNETKQVIAKEIGQLIRKKIKVCEIYHSEEEVGKNTWKLEPDFSGGIKMAELISEPMGYYEAISVLVKVLGWIREKGWTDEKCALHVNISFDEFKTKLPVKLGAINKLKFILGFNEEMVYEKFPKRKNSIYARSINQVIPINRFVFNDNITQIFKENYELPNEKYYGINFTKLAKDYFEVRYLGGRGYERKGQDIISIVNYISTFTHGVMMNNSTYTDSELGKLKFIIKEHKKVVSSFSDLDSFLVNYPNIRVLVDLKGDVQVLKTFYTKIREQLFNLIVRCGVRRGMLNYDADVGKYQLKDAVMTKAFPVSEMEIFDSKIQGNIVDCDLYRCTISNSHIINSNLFSGNTVTKTKIVNTPFHVYNKAIDCYIDNKKKPVNGTVVRGIIRSGDIGPMAKISKETEIIDPEMKGDEKGKGGFKDKVGPSNVGYTKLGIQKDI